ncbi:hypothetical protein [Klebsiella quasipneumoniae]
MNKTKGCLIANFATVPLEALVSEMQKNSPIHDTLANPVEMITRLA